MKSTDYNWTNWKSSKKIQKKIIYYIGIIVLKIKLTRSFLIDFSFSLLLTVAFIFIRGYTFNNGDQADHLLPVYEKIAPGTFQGDFFMDYQSKAFSIRETYILLLYGLSHVAPLSFWCFLLTFLSVFSSIFGWSKLAFLLTENAFVKILAPILIFFVLYSFTVGGCNLMYSIITTSVIAKSLVPWGIWFFLKNKYFQSALIIGIATLFHAIVGLQMFLILGLILILESKTVGWKSLFGFGLIYILVSAIVLYPNISLQFFDTFDYDHNLYNKIFYHFRNPHHYIPSAFPLKDILKYSFILLLVVLFFFNPIKRTKHHRVFLFIGIQTLGLIVYTVFLEGFHVYKFVSIQWFKTTVWTTAFASIFLADWICSLAFVKSIWEKNQWMFHNWIFNISMSLIGLFFILNAHLIPIEKFRTRYQIGNAKPSELQIVHEWILLNTPIHSLFIAPPADYGFGCETLRPAIINAKALVHEHKYMLNWYERITTIYKTEFADLKGRNFVEVCEMNYKNGNFDAEKYKAAYGLVYKPYYKNENVLFQTEKYAVIKF